MTLIVGALLKPLLWLLPVVVVGSILRSPWFKGWWGERQVRELIRRRLNPAVYREFHNVTVRDEFGETTQIDHVYVSPFGVLVIETKHMGHWIFGSRNQAMWTQQIYRNKVRFQNPLRQNHRHIKVLQSLLDLPEDSFKSVVVFTADCTFQTEMPDEVCTLSDLIEYIQSIDTRILSGEQAESICGDLQRLRLEPSFRTHREHIDSLRRRHGGTASVPPPPSRRLSDSLMEAATERLLHAAEDRIRHGGRRRGSRMAQVGLGIMVAKGIVGAMALFLIWWALTTGIGSVVDSLQPAQRVVAPAPAQPPLPAPIAQAPSVMAPAAGGIPQQPAYRQPTAAELAEWQRQSEESMRVLERNTREIPLALPGSPEVGPSAR